MAYKTILTYAVVEDKDLHYFAVKGIRVGKIGECYFTTKQSADKSKYQVVFTAYNPNVAWFRTADVARHFFVERIFKKMTLAQKRGWKAFYIINKRDLIVATLYGSLEEHRAFDML